MPPICLDFVATTFKMQNEMEQLGPQQPLSVEASRTRREAFKWANTYLAKIAIVLQDAPGRMLTFAQLMDKMTPLNLGDRKSAKNNIRVCLSTHKCFVKIPVVPDSINSKRSYWQLDCSRITAKMVRRHFKGLLQLFPELASKLETEILNKAPQQHLDLLPPQPAACRAVQVTCQKFSSPFSIESLLRRDTSPPRASHQQPPQPTHRGAATERSFSCLSEEPDLHPSARSFPIYSAGGSTHHGLSANRAALQAEPSLLFYTGDSPVPYFSSAHSSYITYSLQRFTLDSLHS